MENEKGNNDMKHYARKKELYTPCKERYVDTSQKPSSGIESISHEPGDNKEKNQSDGLKNKQQLKNKKFPKKRNRTKMIKVRLGLGLVILWIAICLAILIVYRKYEIDQNNSFRNNYSWNGTSKLIKSELFDDGEPEYIEAVDYENATIEIYEFLYDKNQLCQINYMGSTEYSTVYSVGFPNVTDNEVDCVFYSNGQIEHWIHATYDSSDNLSSYECFKMDENFFVTGDIYEMTYDGEILQTVKHVTKAYDVDIDTGLDVGEIVSTEIEPQIVCNETLKYLHDDQLRPVTVEVTKYDDNNVINQNYNMTYDEFGGLEALSYKNSTGTESYTMLFGYSKGNITKIDKKYDYSKIHSDNDFTIQYSSRNNRIARLKKAGNKNTDVFQIDEQNVKLANGSDMVCQVYYRKAEIKNELYKNVLYVRPIPLTIGCADIYLHSVSLLQKDIEFDGEVVDGGLLCEGMENGKNASYEYHFSPEGKLVEWSSSWKDSDVVIFKGQSQYSESGKIRDLLESNFEKGIQIHIVYDEKGFPVKIEQTGIERNEKA